MSNGIEQMNKKYRMITAKQILNKKLGISKTTRYDSNGSKKIKAKKVKIGISSKYDTTIEEIHEYLSK